MLFCDFLTFSPVSFKVYLFLSESSNLGCLIHSSLIFIIYYHLLDLCLIFFLFLQIFELHHYVFVISDFLNDTWSYKFSFGGCFLCVPEVYLYYVLIFISFQDLKYFFLDFFLDTLII